MLWLLGADHMISRLLILFTLCSLICFLKFPTQPLLTWNFPFPSLPDYGSGRITTRFSPSPQHHNTLFSFYSHQHRTLSIFLWNKSPQFTQELFSPGEELTLRFPKFSILTDKMKCQFVYTIMLSDCSNSHSLSNWTSTATIIFFILTPYVSMTRGEMQPL
jgi:hypothetical protein